MEMPTICYMLRKSFVAEQNQLVTIEKLNKRNKDRENAKKRENLTQKSFSDMVLK